GDGYVDFDFEFIYTQEVDKDILKSGGYNLAIVFSASRNGDTYDGARGSVLLIDDVKIICDTNF
ncbi:MAG: PCMD domain-containing protein, partial [Bacteroidaceae bacterium]|nr:PCMD domain-containing protein [Bacteroidaceae bacterium]